MEIGHGIDVKFENRKKIQNTVFFSDESKHQYPIGGMLFEIINDKSQSLMTDRVQNFIKLYPGNKDLLSKESITCAFKWLYGTVIDEQCPIATTLFRSQFNKLIINLLQDPKVTSYNTAGDFLFAVGEDYNNCVEFFNLTFDALATSNSGIADSIQEEYVSAFKDCADKLYDKFFQRHNKGNANSSPFQIDTLLELLIFEYCRMKKEGILIKICPNCGRYFIPQHRSDTIYCPDPSPQNPQRSCQEIGPRLKRDSERRTDPLKAEKNRDLAQKGMRAKRARDIGNTSLAEEYDTALNNALKKWNI